MQKIRVIQVATGMAGRAAIRAMSGHPLFELAGCMVFSDEKAGQDAGALAGIAATGITATRDLAEICSIQADAVCFTSIWPDLDLICPLLESGKHVVLTCGLVFPSYLGSAVVARLEQSCRIGKTAVFGGGLSPGFIQCMAPAMLSSLARRIDSITMEELCDVSTYNSAALMVDMLGMGKTEAAVRSHPHPQFGTMVPEFFHQTIALMAQALCLNIDEYRTRFEYGISRSGKQVSFCNIAPGTIGAVRVLLSGVAQGVERLIVKLNWIADFDVSGDWIGRDELSNAQMWRIQLEGDPPLRMTVEQVGKGLERGAHSTDHGVVSTVMNVLHAIPHLTGRIGIQTYNSLPIFAGCYAVGRK